MVLSAASAAGLIIDEPGPRLVITSPRSIRRNRWAARLVADLVAEQPNVTVVAWIVEMLGDKHFTILDEVRERFELKIDDNGIPDAASHLVESGASSTRRTIDGLNQVVRLDERVLELADGIYNGDQGVLVLTNQRLFFASKKVTGRIVVDQFDFVAIQTVRQSYDQYGGTIEIATPDQFATISRVAQARSEALINALVGARGERASHDENSSSGPSTGDLVEHLTRLGDLLKTGVLTLDEFNAQKLQILNRMSNS